MSVLFATYSEHYIILCADKQATNTKNAKAGKAQETKVEKWLSELAVGYSGNMKLANIIRSAVHSLIDEKVVEDYSVEAVAQLFEDAYPAAKEVYPDMRADVVVKFAVAGKTKDGKNGVAEVYISDAETLTTVHVCKNAPMTMVFEPDDVAPEVCSELFERATVTSKNTNMNFMDLMVLIHQKAVRFVSLRSKYVSAKADVVIL